MIKPSRPRATSANTKSLWKKIKILKFIHTKQLNRLRGSSDRRTTKHTKNGIKGINHK